MKAILPGPTMPFFWIAVKISLFQKQVYKMNPEYTAEEGDERKATHVFHGVMATI